MLEWLERAASKGWSADRLHREMKRKSAGKAGVAGPRFRGKADMSGALDEVDELSDKWLRRYDALWGEEAYWRTIRQLDDPEVPDRLKEVREKLVALQEAARDLNERLKKIANQTKQKSRGR
jgi:hypothetical protein